MDNKEKLFTQGTQLPQASIVTLSEAIKLSRQFHNNLETIVLATGVFDVFHLGHANFLKSAAKLGKWLFVGVERDQRVKQLKGTGRPIRLMKQRLGDVASLSQVDYIFPLPFPFDSDTSHAKLISQLRPEILAVSSHSGFLEEKEKILNQFGGRVVVAMQQDPTISTSLLVEHGLDKQK